ncbi:RNA 2',3'-cyclic phosphodiesterase [Heliophilum fasciatum]|uniref:RNA 2',3'-cyclic phosphodiesterase n=1 Tax=Heliophilum fasciatum TaxID=35700 RepID=Q0Q0I5_9FIRM|nr:RNA 2',3'-cyclic phosphodiesterase [Heliophilum fasciatum]ABG57079.2 LigT [Heliophilum fasciatum]MCW2278462.1 2'-5' RNA ligase [Heliophilum fasciatum]TCP63592.1 2'-5' RNA ligase [Heliophilum fasciatum]
MRLFFAITLPETVTKALTDLQWRVRFQLKRGNYTQPDNFHITVAFLGEQPDDVPDLLIPPLNALAKYTSPFSLTLDGMGRFGYGNPFRALWMGVQGERTRLNYLQETVSMICEVLGYPTEERHYRPHVTLVRHAVFPPNTEEVMTWTIPRNKATFKVNHFVLMESVTQHGRVVYRPVHTFHFGLPESARILMPGPTINAGTDERDV